MLTIIVPGDEAYGEEDSKFITVGDVTLDLEHSLVSLSKWESKYEKPFLGHQEKTLDEVVGYVKAMTLSPDVPDEIYSKLTEENWAAIQKYIETKHSATFFSNTTREPRTREPITSELVYYWMTVFQIPFECETWHLNRLFTLIQVCNMKQAKPKKMSKAEVTRRNRELNAQRREQLGTKG